MSREYYQLTYKVWIRKNPENYDEINAFSSIEAAEKFCDKYFWLWDLYEKGNYWHDENCIIVEYNGDQKAFEIEVRNEPVFYPHEAV